MSTISPGAAYIPVASMPDQFPLIITFCLLSRAAFLGITPNDDSAVRWAVISFSGNVSRLRTSMSSAVLSASFDTGVVRLGLGGAGTTGVELLELPPPPQPVSSREPAIKLANKFGTKFDTKFDTKFGTKFDLLSLGQIEVFIIFVITLFFQDGQV